MIQGKEKRSTSAPKARNSRKSNSDAKWLAVKRFVETVMVYELGSVCVDLDSVLLHHNPSDGISHLGPVLPRGRELVKLLKSRNYRVVVLTSRPDNWPGDGITFADIQADLRLADIPVDEVTNMKPPADAYLDDKAYRIPKNWR